MRKLLRALFLVALVHACGGDRPPPEEVASTGLEVGVEHRPELRETVYSVEAEGCRISWIVYGAEVNRGVITHRPECRLSLGDQAPLLSALLRAVLRSDPGAADFRTLSWGRLYPDGEAHPTMAERLALAAVGSPDWDPTEGRPRQGDVNGWIRWLANHASIYEELRSAGRDAGVEIQLSSVEKVLVERADLLPFFEVLRSAGALGTDRVPFDCQAWFSLSPLVELDQEGGGGAA